MTVLAISIGLSKLLTVAVLNLRDETP